MMPPGEERYVLDANVFIQAKRRFYGLDFCPGFWNVLVHHRESGRLCSIDRVRKELETGNDELTHWALEHFRKEGLKSTDDEATVAQYRSMLHWAKSQQQFNPDAIHEFQQVADGWLVAFAKAHGYTVVTLEEHNPVIKKKVPIPNICHAHGVGFITPFEMLRRLAINLSWILRP